MFPITPRIIRFPPDFATSLHSHANVSGTEGIAMAIRHVAPDEVRVNTLDVTSHHSKKVFYASMLMFVQIIHTQPRF
jgi:hypothetical protein